MQYQEQGNPSEAFPSVGENWAGSRARRTRSDPSADPRAAFTRAEQAVYATKEPPPSPRTPPAVRERKNQNRALLGLVLCLAALAIGFVALKISPASKVGPFGLIQALSPLYYVALIVLIISFILTLRTDRWRSWILSAHLTVMVFLVHGAPAVIEQESRFQTAYLHVGFVDYIANSGSVLENYDARFSWPSFFEAIAMLDKVAGVSSAEIWIHWWPVAINLLYLPLIWHIAKQFLGSELKAWVATGLFPLANWEAQDYFSPQSLAYFLYLTFIFLLVVPLGERGRSVWQRLFERKAKEPAKGRSTQTRKRLERVQNPALLLGALVLLMAAMATGHQLTPIMAIVAILVLIVSGRTRVRGLAVVVILLAIGWICYGANNFWAGHENQMLGGLGNVGGNVNSGVADRASGSYAHAFAGHIRELISVFVWGLALLGALVWRPKNGDRGAVLLLFLAAFSVIIGGNYGGEGVLRVYLFSLPGAVCLIAALITSLPRFWQGQVALACTLFLLTPLFLVARWGNELYEMVRPGEIAATTVLYNIARPGSTLVSANSFMTWKYTNIIGFDYETVSLSTLGPQTVSQITSLVEGNPKGGLFILTADQEEYGSLVLGMPENWGATLGTMLAHSPNYKLRYSNADAEIFQYIPAPKTRKSAAAAKSKNAAK